MPEEGVPWLPRAEILTFEEIERVASVAHRLGVDSLRLTGGEPLVRAGVTDLVARLGRIGFSDLSMTTNGTGLARVAPDLAAAGLHRVNISCDSLRPSASPPSAAAASCRRCWRRWTPPRRPASFP